MIKTCSESSMYETPCQEGMMIKINKEDSKDNVNKTTYETYMMIRKPNMTHQEDGNREKNIVDVGTAIQ